MINMIEKNTADFLADISQITPKFREIVPPFHGQGNCISFAAIRWHDFGDRPSLGRPFAQIFRLPDTPSCRFHLAVDFPGLRRSGSWSQIISQAQDVGEQASRDCDFGELERDVATVGATLAPILISFSRKVSNVRFGS